MPGLRSWEVFLALRCRMT